jgi:hypothetical protein
LLLAGGLIDVLPEDLPTELADPFDMLSFLFLDGAGVSKLGIHTDTDQLMPCVCSCDSLYPPGCYDFTGGEFSWANGVWADPYARNDAVIVLGHTTTHTVLPLTPPREVFPTPDRSFVGVPCCAGPLCIGQKGGRVCARSGASLRLASVLTVPREVGFGSRSGPLCAVACNCSVVVSMRVWGRAAAPA